jgi:hypothetical protein
MAKSKAGGHRPGGGIASKQHVRKPVKTGAPRERVIPTGVAQLGQKQGNHAMGRGTRLDYSGVEMFGGTGLKSDLGNELSAKIECGPGGGRKVYACGSQGVQGKPSPGSPMPKARALFEGWEK